VPVPTEPPFHPRSPDASPEDADLSLLSLAASRVLGGMNGSAESLHREAVHDALNAILAAASPGFDPDTVRSSLPGELVLRRSVLDRLRAELLRTSARTEGSPRELVDLLRRLEEVREALEPDWSPELEAGLLGPAGLGLSLGVAHDLRSPLSAVLLLCDSLRTGLGGRLPEGQARQVAVIQGAARSMLSVVNDTIDHCGPAGPSPDEEVSAFSVEELLDSVSGIVRPLAEQRGLAFVASGPEGDARVGHPEALTRVLLNLAQNAVRSTREGFVEVRVTELETDWVRFAVRDSGAGIADPLRRSLFRSFRRFDRMGELRFSPSGLGLTVARALVESMGSELECESRPGEGTVFSFTLRLPPA
jgi:signal transduction histidine kinase